MIPSSRQQNFRRLGYYLTGVALGCVLIGIYFQGRKAYVARRAEAQRAEAQRAAVEQRAADQRLAPPPAQPAAPVDPAAKTPEPGVK